MLWSSRAALSVVDMTFFSAAKFAGGSNAGPRRPNFPDEPNRSMTEMTTRRAGGSELRNVWLIVELDFAVEQTIMEKLRGEAKEDKVLNIFSHFYGLILSLPHFQLQLPMLSSICRVSWYIVSSL